MKTVFLDLDGTLTDPAPGITRSVIHALKALGRDAPEPAALSWVIGPPLLDSFAALGVPDPAAALALYRERFAAVGLYENRVYSGVFAALESMAARYELCLATAKPLAFATRISAHLGLDRHLSAQFGPELDGSRGDKAELLAYALEKRGADAGDCVMVGDRVHDIDAANSAAMPSIGALWGYGAPGELAAATARCDTPAPLAETVAEVLG